MQATRAYDAAGRSITVPEAQIAWLYSDHSAVWLRGNAHVLAVLDPSGQCVGWILKDDVPASRLPSLEAR